MWWTLFHKKPLRPETLCSLREEPSDLSGGPTNPETDTETQPPKLEKPIRCGNCKTPLSDEALLCTVGGYPAIRSVSNPQGVIFEVLTVQNAWNLLSVGNPSTEFSWFAGYAWTVVGCTTCQNHIGWQFHTLSDASPKSFYGLIRKQVAI